MAIGAALIGGAVSAYGANKAADAQEDAANKSAQAQRRAQRVTTRNLAPYRNTGGLANNALAYEMGLTTTAPEGYAGFTATPGYQYQLDQGNANINALAGSNGGLYSGATMQALQENAIGLANQDYGNYLTRLSNMQGVGLNAAAGVGNAAQNAANGLSTAYSAAGNAAAAGAVGTASAINSGINNGLGIWSYQNALNPTANGRLTIGGNLFGGNSWGG